MANVSLQSEAQRPIPLILPPYLYGSVLAVGVVLHFLLPIRVFSRWQIGIIAGMLLLAVGVFVLVWAVRTFTRGGVDPRFKPVGNLVTTGPFAYSRNPMYIAFTLIYLGISLLVNTAWSLFFLLPVLITMHHGVIRREERYLTSRFGEEYQRYRAQVRRWV